MGSIGKETRDAKPSLGVMLGLNLLHPVLLACAITCLLFTRGEVRHRPLTLARLWTPPLSSLGVAFVFLVIHLGTRQPAWTFGAAGFTGAIVGLVRGLTLNIEVDHMFDKVRLPRARFSFVLALLLLGAVVLEITGAFSGPVHLVYREFAPELAAFSAGVLTVRAIVIRVRWRWVPYVDLHRA